MSPMTDETVREQFEAIVNEFAEWLSSERSERIYSRERSKLVGMLMEAKIFETGRRAGMEEGAKIAEEWKAGWMATNHGSSVASAIRERLK